VRHESGHYGQNCRQRVREGGGVTESGHLLRGPQGCVTSPGTTVRTAANGSGKGVASLSPGTY